MKEKLSRTAPFIVLGLGAAALLFGVLSGDAELEFTQDALEEIADRAIDTGTGARALHSILAKTLRRVLYDAPDSRTHGKIVIDKTAIGKSVTLTADPDSGAGESLQSIIGNYAK